MRVFTIILAFSISAIAYPVEESVQNANDIPIVEVEENGDNACYVPDNLENNGIVGHGHSSFHHKAPTNAFTAGTGSATSIPSMTSSSNLTATSSRGNLSTFTSKMSSSTVSGPVPTGNVSASSLTTTQSIPTITYTSSISTSSSQPTAQPTALRGVNIGHWLVIEPWMDDGKLMIGKFKSAPDQWTFDTLDTDGSAIKQHWDTWFTRGDVQRLKNYGFNALRIPIGYWSFNNENTPYRKGAIEYMDQAIGWARDIGMKVMIDCHGSPGSQNGQMHSGHQGAIKWQSGDNLNLSTIVLQQMVQRWGTVANADTVFAIEIVSTYMTSFPSLTKNIYTDI